MSQTVSSIVEHNVVYNKFQISDHVKYLDFLSQPNIGSPITHQGKKKRSQMSVDKFKEGIGFHVPIFFF